MSYVSSCPSQIMVTLLTIMAPPLLTIGEAGSSYHRGTLTWLTVCRDYGHCSDGIHTNIFSVDRIVYRLNLK